MDAALTRVDLVKFYDTIRPVAEKRRRASCSSISWPTWHRAPSQYLGAVSEWLNPGVSIVQGSRNSNNWARILLYDALERAQAHVPRVYPYQWVDDINLLAIGTQRLSEMHSPGATLELLAGLRNKGLRISPKSQIVASRPVLARSLASVLELEGGSAKIWASISQEAAPTVASSIANARVRPPSGRAACGSSRNSRGQRSGCAQKVSSQVLPAASRSWAHRVQAYATRNIRLRLDQTHSLPSSTTGKSQRKTWLEAWTDSENFRRRFRRAWPHVFARISEAPQNKRWRRTHGPIGGIVAKLLDDGWDAPHPERWTSPDGTTFLLSEADLLSDPSPLFRCFQASLWADSLAGS